MVRRAARADANQPAIVKEFRKCGCSVQHLHTVGQGCPDLIVGISGVNVLIEIKDGDKKPSDQKLTEDEAKWHEEWRGMKVEIVIFKEDVLPLVNRVRGCK